MLILIEQIHRVGADSEPTIRKVGINPDVIEQANPHEDAKIGACSVLALGGVGLMYCTNSVEEVVRMTQEAMWGPPRCNRADSDTE